MSKNNEDFKSESVRSNCVLRIEQALEYAREHGFRVVVASDEEGNNWNELKTRYIDEEGTKKDIIALGVARMVEEDEVFEPVEFCHAQVGEDFCEAEVFRSEYCKKHFREFIIDSK